MMFFLTNYRSLSSDVHQAYEELSNLDESQLLPKREAEELFNLPDGVQIFFITADGRVSTFSEPSSLRIFRFKDRLENEPENLTFIQVLFVEGSFSRVEARLFDLF
jgi:hypothetical protein